MSVFARDGALGFEETVARRTESAYQGIERRIELWLDGVAVLLDESRKDLWRR